MTGSFRTASGGRIKRDKTVSFTFDGVTMKGVEGDTLASALIANGVHFVGRSFKYHRKRGIQSAGSEEANALVTVIRDAARTTPNLRATQVELYEGLSATSQNYWPSLKYDIGALNNLAAPIFASGFYYKTFMWPKSFWKKVYEPRIQAAAGFGRAPEAPDTDRYQQRYAHCDVLVIGAGPAGLTAAMAAMDAGARVIICDEGSEFGGSALTDLGATIEGQPALSWVQSMVLTLGLNDRVTCLTRTTAFTATADNLIGLAERITEHQASPAEHLPRERLWQVRAKRTIIAAGALERPLVFPENDRPGIMMADAARTYVNRYGVKPGNKAVVATACDSAYAAAIDLKKAGVAIAAIVDIRAEATAAAEAAKAEGITVHLSSTICGTTGGDRVKSVEIGHVSSTGQVKGGIAVPCDLVLMSGGWTPSLHVFSMGRGKVRFDAERQMFLPGTYIDAHTSVGACNGTFDLSTALNESYVAGIDAARACGIEARGVKTFDAAGGISMAGHYTGALPHNRNAARVKAFVDFQHDVTAKDIKLAVREGFRSIEHVKRYTTTGMATDQGKSSNINALAIAAGQMGKEIPQVGLTTFRPPYTPTTFGIFAGVQRGDLFDPVRKTPSHEWMASRGAEFEPVGLWMRAWYLPQKGEDMHKAVDRECLAVRNGVGMFDASTLGKIEVVGPDAAEFLHRMYTNPFLKLEVGKARYGILCRDDGFVYDDGVIGRIADDRFHVTTTTGGAPRVLGMMEDYLQTEWPDLKVWLTSTTEQWATVAVQGPKARAVVAKLVDFDLSNEAFPHMSVKETMVLGVPARVFRMSFTGEMGYEINVPADYGTSLWEAVYEAGREFDIVPYGTETMHVLRAEKGYIIVGQDTDGTLTPDDAGVGWAVGKSKPDFVGKRGMKRPDLTAPNRKQLVGLVAVDKSIVLEEGAQITLIPDPPIGTHAVGHVTSAYHSATLGHGIALANLENGRARIGNRVFIPMPGGTIPVEVVDPVFYDKEGKRLHG